MSQSSPEKIVQETLANFANPDTFFSHLETAFGTNIDREIAQRLQQQWQTGEDKNLPEITLLQGEILQTANGAYSQQTNTIYLSQDYFSKATPQQLTTTVLEEIGHFLDTQLNKTDSQGDEGAIFAHLIQHNQIPSWQLKKLQTENDITTINLNGELIEIEKQDPYTGDNLGDIIDGLDELITTLQDALNSEIFANSLPLVGDSLQNAIDTPMPKGDGILHSATSLAQTGLVLPE